MKSKTLKKALLTAVGVLAAAGQGLLMAQSSDKNTVPSKNIVVLLAHPNFGASKANRALIDEIKNIKGVKIIDIYAAPFTAEYYAQEITKADIIIFQFPFYWASAPSQLKKWCDEIFMAFAAQVKDKKLMVATTTGSEYEAYRSGGRNRYTMDELLRPYQLLANHSGMQWLTPYVLYGASLPDAPKTVAQGAKDYKKLISELTK